METVKYPHAIAASELKEKLKTDLLQGLSDQEAKRRQKTYGVNEIKRSSNGIFKLFLRQVLNPMSIILLIATLVSLIYFSKLDALIISMALSVNILVGFWQEKKASGIFKALSSRLKVYAYVLRDGQKHKIPAQELVPGDIVFVESGSMIPADARLFEVKDLSVNESALTGESKLVHKSAETLQKDTPIYDMSNMVFSGTLAQAGFGKAVVVRIGEQTEFGKIAHEAKGQKELTPLQRQMKKLAIVLGVTLTGLSGAVGVFAYLNGYTLYEAGLIVLSLAVSAVPEGLPAAIAVTLAVGMERILKKDGLIKHSASAETLGSVDYILSDKTGTITTGDMELVGLVSMSDVLKSGDLTCNLDKRRAILEAATLASDAFLDKKGNTIKAVGRPIEKAILSFALDNGFSQDAMFMSGYARENLIPFSSSRRFAISLNMHPTYTSLVTLTGAPEPLMDISDYVFTEDNNIEFTKDLKEKFIEYQKTLNSKGYRTTAVARMVSNHIPSELEKGEKPQKGKVVFLGILVFEDEIRDEVKDAIAFAEKMGIKVLMVTGDHFETALAVAKRVNLAENGFQVVTGQKFESFSDDKLNEILDKGKIKIFARMLPHQKMRLVKTLKDRGQIVAMTGDGVNDAPALVKADIGIAVESGTDVAKASADMVLLKNSFKVITYAIEEGRSIALNIRRIIMFMVSTSFGELALISGAVLAGAPLPLLPQHLLWHNMIDGGLMNFPFAFEKGRGHKGTPADFKEMNRKGNRFIWIYGVISSFLFLSLYALLLALKIPQDDMRTIMFLVLTFSGLTMALSLKSLRDPVWRTNIFANRFFNFALAANLALLTVAFVYAPVERVLRLVLPNLVELGIILLFVFLNWFAIEILKKRLF